MTVRYACIRGLENFAVLVYFAVGKEKMVSVIPVLAGDGVCVISG